MDEKKKKFSWEQEYGIEKEIAEALAILKYNEPTEIQRKVLPDALAGRDIVGKSKTGSGKTAAYGIPICKQAQWEKNQPGALVLLPTRELVVQVAEELSCIGRKKRVKVADVFGGFPVEKQILTLKQKNHVVAGTPGRLLDHISRGSIDLSQIKILVIDEADLMLDMGFLGDVEQIITQLPPGQRMLFSATIGEHLQGLIDAYMKNPVIVNLEEEEVAPDILQKVIMIDDPEKKYEAFIQTLITENPESAMIFCGTREMVEVLCRKMGREGIRCGMLHGEIDQQDRLRTVDSFRRGRFPYLIATDVAARGIDFANLSHVFNYDFPTGKETYVHRIGRTGRNGADGCAISFVTKPEEKMLGDVEDYTKQSLIRQEIPMGTEEQRKTFFAAQNKKVVLKEKKGAGFRREITKLTIGGGKKSKMRAVDIVGTICGIEGISAEDIGIIDIRESITYVDILNGKGNQVLLALQERTIKGKYRKVRITR